MSTLISALLDAIFGSLAEATGLSDRLRQLLGREPERLAFGAALTQALTDVANEFPGRDLRYFTEMLPQFAGPLLARYLQPAASLPTVDELTQQWLSHLTIDSRAHYRTEFEQFATHFLNQLQFHLENQQPLQWIIEARRQRSSEKAIRRMADAAEQSAITTEALRQEVSRLNATLMTILQTGRGSTVNTGGGAYNAGTISAQNFAGRDLTINNYIVDGLVHVASYNPGRRIRKFLNEYLGSAENPVPFGGRQAQLDELNGWIDDPTAQPYYLLAAEAGRGKSALVCRWMAQLLQRDNVEVVFIPISIRFEMASQKEVFEALAARLAKVHQEAHRSEATHAVLSPQQWRTVCETYLDRLAPVGKQLVVILDGLDEATDWQIGAGFFSDEPPPGLRVLVTARLRASENTPQAWAATLGWPARLARLQTLLPLSRSGVEEALVSMGNPLDQLPNQQAVTDQLYRLSEEGDPLLVKLYVDALFAKRAQAAFLRAEDLTHLKPGFHEYFKHWWEGQKVQWQAAGRNPLRTEQSVLHLLNLLSAALGPLKKVDLSELAPEQFTDGILLDEWLTDINRWVIGDGVEQGYTFSHPRFGYYFWEEKILPRQQQELDKRFTVWGERVLAELNAGTLAPAAAPSYLLQHYAAHLERSGAPPVHFYALISDGWRKAWEVLDVSYAGFLNDLERIKEQATYTNSPNRSGRAEALVQQVRVALCQASISTLSLNMPPELLVQLVKANLRSPTQALAIARLSPNEKQQAKMLTLLMPYLPQYEREIAFSEALAAIQLIEDESDRAKALGELGPELPESHLMDAINLARTIVKDDILASTLGMMAARLEKNKQLSLLTEAVEIARYSYTERYITKSQYTNVLCTLVPFLPDELLALVLADINFLEGTERANVLSCLAERVTDDQRQEIINEIFTIVNSSSGVDFLYELLDKVYLHLPEEFLSTKIEEYVSELTSIIGWSGDKGIDGLHRLAPYMSKALIRRAFTIIRSLEYEPYLSESLKALGHYLPKDLMKDALTLTRKIEWTYVRVDTLVALIPHLPHELIDEALEVARLVEFSPLRARALSAFEPIQMPEIEWVNNLKEAMYAIRAIKDEPAQVNVVSMLIPHLPAIQNRAILAEILVVVQSINQRYDRAIAIAKLTVCATDDKRLEILEEALKSARFLWGNPSLTKVLKILADHLPKTLMSEALEMAESLLEEHERAEAIEVLAPYLPEELMRRVLTDALGYSDIETLIVLVPHLSLDLMHEVLGAMPSILSHSGGDTVLLRIVSNLPQELMENALALCLSIEDGLLQSEMLTNLAPRLSTKLIREALLVAHSIKDNTWRFLALCGLVAYLSEQKRRLVLKEALTIAKSLQDPMWLWYAYGMSSLAPYLPEKQKVALLGKTLVGINNMRIAPLAPVILAKLWAYLPEELMEEALTTARYLHFRKDALKSLCPYLPPRLLEKALSMFRSVGYRYGQAQVVRFLVPYLPETQRAIVATDELRAISLLRDESGRSDALNEIALLLTDLTTYMPINTFIAFAEILPICASRSRSEFLDDLAALMPFILALAGDEAPQTAEGIYHAIQEVYEWWP